jgi:hypothetical protein
MDRQAAHGSYWGNQPGNDSPCQQARCGRFCPGALRGEGTKGLGWQAPQGLSS